jgi:tellurite resistance protein
MAVGALLAGHAAMGMTPRRDTLEEVRQAVDMATVDQALSVLRGSSASARMAFLNACEAVASFDGTLTEQERVVVRCFELVLAVQQ